MALSGAMILLFIIGHALGNLLIFSGQNSLNTYAYWLQNSPMLWVFRITMLIFLLLHSVLAIRLYLQNRSARPVQYAINQDIQLTFSAKTMIFSGVIILAFIVFHIAHLTLGWVSTTSLDIQAGHSMIDVYSNVVRGFQQPAITVFYVCSVLVIGLHLHHSIKSLFQTLGFHHQNFHQLIDYLAPAMIIILSLAFMSIPLAALFGFLPLPVTVLQ
ncbi:MAG: succinate dehydrogenase cytochrome b subunit [Proteobacteria bacterium]|nr:succinate dehydrogenase cytochrome b subunit [Pseudomonadota bacterium]